MKMGAALALVLSALPTIAHGEWYQASSTHFTVYAEGKPDALKDYIAGLERYDSAMRVLYARPDLGDSSTDRVTIFVVPASQVERLYGRGGSDVAGFYNARASGSIAFASNHDEGSVEDGLSAQAVLFHEYAHHFMFTAWPNVPFPTWLIEGFAEFNAPSKTMPDGSVEIGLPPNYRAFGIFNQDMSLRDLMKTSNSRALPEPLEQALYGRGWLLLHYLMLDPARSHQLAAYINAVTGGMDPQSAAEKSFGSLTKLDGELNHYAEGHLFAMKVPAARLKVGPVSVRPLTPGEVAVMPALLRSKRGVDAKTAPAVAVLAEKLAAPFPNDPGAQNELAEAENDAGHFEASDAAAARALAADPVSLHALIYRGMDAMAIAVRDKVSDPARWTDARGWFLKANKVDVENAEPLRLFYESFILAHQTPTANAQAALLYAQALAPFDDGLRLTAANVLLQQDKGSDARAMLQPLAYNPHAGGLATLATSLIAAIDKDGAKGALALMKPAADGSAQSSQKGKGG